MASVSGMAASIRAATESETFDLAGNSTSTIENTIQSAFAQPLPLRDTMIRITFVTGAGKLGRSRYEENAAKVLTSTLRDLGYVEDRGASCVVECAGCFKSQHDTGKNLKTIVVFPLIEGSGSSGLEDGMGGMNVDDGGPPVLEEGTPKHLIAFSSLKIFEGGLQRKCPSWSQKKAMVGVIGEIKAIVTSLDEKLLKGTPLNDAEQDFYDSCDLSSLEAKEAHAKSEMAKQVDEQRITALEKKRLLSQVGEKLGTVEEGIASANGKPKKLEKLKAQKEKLTERESMLSSITPIAPPPLRFQAEIEKLRKEMQPLLKLEKETKGRLLSVKETTTLARKTEIEEEILELEEMSRGWFEDDEDFGVRVEASRAQARSRANVKKIVKKSGSGAGRGAGGGARKPITNWVVPGATKRPASRPAAKKSSASKNTFAAMMMDSDSDSD